MAIVTSAVGLLLLLTAPHAAADIPPPPTSEPTTTTTTAAAAATTTTAAPTTTATTPITAGVDVIKVDGLLDPVMVAFVRDAIASARPDDTLAVVLTLDSEGAVVADEVLLDLVEQMRRSPVPVDVWVGPSGSSATGDAAALLAGARTIGIAPGARIGGAVDLPTDFSGAAGDGIGPTAAVADAGLFGPGARIIGAPEAKDLGITKADAPTILEFLVTVPGFTTIEKQVDGRTVREPSTIVRFGQLDLVHQLFHAVASPSSAYLLLSIGLALLVFELFTAGVGVAGIVGATCFVFGCYGMVTLPTRPWALAFVVLAFAALAVDVQTGVPRFWTAAGLGLYLLGSLALFDGVSMSWITLVAGLGGVALAFLSGMPSMVRTRFSTPTIGREWMVGELGRAITPIAPDGTVQVLGGRWRAFTNRATPIEELDRVRVVGVEGLVLEVEPEEGGARDYRERTSRTDEPSPTSAPTSAPTSD